MNKRIRELHKQVMIWNDTPDCSYNAEFFVPEQYTQKFAELIVKGCVEVIEAQTTVWRNTGIPAEVALDMAKENVKAYFGVQE